MKTLMFGCVMLMAIQLQAQTITGTWQLTDEKSCFQAEMKESQTEKELVPQMGSSSATSVARLITFDKKGRGKEGVFTSGSKKGTSTIEFKYTITGQNLLMLDAKSGLMIRQLVIEELTDGTLRFHDAKKDCEIKSFVKIK